MQYSVSYVSANYNYEDYIKNALIENIELLDFEVEITLDNDKNLNIESLKNVSIDSVSKDSGSFKATLENVNGAKTRVTGKYQLYKNIYFSSRSIRKGQLISDYDISRKKIYFQQNKNDNVDILDLDGIIGMQAAVNIPRNSPINKNLLTSPLFVRERDLVDMIYSSGNIILKTKGVALRSGMLGDLIKVKNQTTGFITSGVVIGKGTIEIGDLKN